MVGGSDGAVAEHLLVGHRGARLSDCFFSARHSSCKVRHALSSRAAHLGSQRITGPGTEVGDTNDHSWFQAFHCWGEPMQSHC